MTEDVFVFLFIKKSHRIYNGNIIAGEYGLCISVLLRKRTCTTIICVCVCVWRFLWSAFNFAYYNKI